ncbi:MULTISPECIES: hypothetical protein [Nostocaceae]|uniref:hypothetical protein n=1 Tax=Nostocaceae TaxID=1162 RepID=UPI00168B3BE8|nr:MULTISPECIES: hypothetical protein [Nostocaceae]MBD2479511.1 hypothetical protein [Anabaena sp. FACHB-83]
MDKTWKQQPKSGAKNEAIFDFTTSVPPVVFKNPGLHFLRERRMKKEKKER